VRALTQTLFNVAIFPESTPLPTQRVPPPTPVDTDVTRTRKERRRQSRIQNGIASISTFYRNHRFPVTRTQHLAPTGVSKIVKSPTHQGEERLMFRNLSAHSVIAFAFQFMAISRYVSRLRSESCPLRRPVRPRAPTLKDRDRLA
jgi:hypothetical protein